MAEGKAEARHGVMIISLLSRFVKSPVWPKIRKLVGTQDFKRHVETQV